MNNSPNTLFSAKSVFSVKIVSVSVKCCEIIAVSKMVGTKALLLLVFDILSVRSCEKMSRLASAMVQDGCDKGIVGRWPMISAISNLSSSRPNSTAPKSSEFQQQPGRAGPAPAFLAYVASAQIFVRPHQTGRPSVPSAVEAVESRTLNLEVRRACSRALEKRNGRLRAKKPMLSSGRASDRHWRSCAHPFCPNS